MSIFNNVFAAATKSGAVKASVSFKDADGVTVSIKPAVAPVGNLFDTAAWAEACSAAGAAISEKGKDENGLNYARNIGAKDCTAKYAEEASKAMFPGVKFKKRSGSADTVQVEPSVNGSAH